MIFFFYFLKNEYPFHRFAVSVNKKIGKAVQRNYIKRKVKELFRLNQDMVEEKTDFWVVIKKRFTRENAQEIKHLFVRSLEKINHRC